MKSTKFYSYYSVMKLSNNIECLAKLPENEEFVENFEANLSFSCFKEDLRGILNKYSRIRDEMQLVDARLKSAFGDFLPSVVLRKLAKSFTAQDLPQDLQ